MFEFQYFALTAAHKENLIKRGFTEATIVRNQYRSLGQSYEWLQNYPKYKQLYSEQLPTIRENKTLRKKWNKEVIAGFAVADYLLQKGCTLAGVPGFFTIGGHWCFNIVPGMLIPTRNISGQIVSLQVRRDKPKDWETTHKGKTFLRYLTLSSKGLPEGVTEDISRAHYPLGNPVLGPDAEVCITEGPLKADAAIELLGEGANLFFVALHGTLNTKELPGFFKLAKSKGIQYVENAFDMDKTTNVHVANAGKRVWKQANEAGLAVRIKCWDEVYAAEKYLELALLCAEHDIFVPTTLNIFTDIAGMARALEAQDIMHSRTILPDGTEVKHYWDDRTKGIDDFLLSQKSEQTSREPLK